MVLLAASLFLASAIILLFFKPVSLWHQMSWLLPWSTREPDRTALTGKASQASHDSPAPTTPAPRPDSPSTPKASAALPPAGSAPVPSIALDPPAAQAQPKPAQTPSQLMPPPPQPGPSKRTSLAAGGSPPLALPKRSASLRAPTSGSSPNRTASLAPSPRAPPQRTSSVAAPTSSTLPAPKRARQKVVLQPGHSPLDWAQLTATTPQQKLAGVPALQRVTPSLLKTMNGRKGAPAWSAFGGKVYNIGPYMPFHPGGEGELKRGAGRVGDALFDEVHPWVNVDNMLRGCLVGILVGESEQSGASELEDMD